MPPPECSYCSVLISPPRQAYFVAGDGYKTRGHRIACAECYDVELAAMLLRRDDRRCPQCNAKLEGAARYPFCSCGYEHSGSMFDLKVQP